jgi:hypothetical protein
MSGGIYQEITDLQQFMADQGWIVQHTATKNNVSATAIPLITGFVIGSYLRERDKHQRSDDE